MRLLRLEDDGEFSLVEFVGKNIPPYAILSHTWGPDNEEVTFKDLVDGTGKGKAGYSKIRFCGKQAANDGLHFCWVDTCSIDKSSSAELSEAINSMFQWYYRAAKCYVYLSDVSIGSCVRNSPSSQTWKLAFRRSRWFTRGWTLQELLAPKSVEFFSTKGDQLGNKISLAQEIYDITGISVQALEGNPLSQFSVDERMSWANKRETKREEDAAYSLLGIFDIHMPLLYGEGRKKALIRLQKEIEQSLRDELPALPVPLSTEEPKRSREPFSAMPLKSNPGFVDLPDSLVARLYKIMCQERDSVANKLAPLPRDSALLSSVIHTSPYKDWVRSGGVLWCSTQGIFCPLTSSTVAAMIAQYSAASHKDLCDTDIIALYPEVPPAAKDKASNSNFQDTSYKRSHTLHFLRTLIVQLFPISNTLADLQSMIRNLPDNNRGTLGKMLKDPESETTESLIALLHCVIGIRNSPLVIAMDNAHVIAQEGFDDLLKALTDPPKRMHNTRVHFIVGGKPEAALVEALTGARSVDLNTEYYECLESLYFEGQHTRREQIAIAHHDTSGWIWTHPSYVAWKEDSSSVLWIEGKPGSGKSVIAKEMQKVLAEDQKTHTCDWFFSTRGRHTHMAHTSFMRSILYQLLQQSQSLFQHFQEIYREYAPRSCLPWESLHAMQEILRNIIATGFEVQCLVDAMDEAETGNDDGQNMRMLLVTLSNLVGIVEQSRFKIIVCSRPFLDIDVEFGRHQRLFGNIHKIVLQEENSGTIRTIVDAGIDLLRNAMRVWGDNYSPPHSLGREVLYQPKQFSPFQEKQKRKEDSMFERFRSYLLANAQGVVLWVTLMLGILESTIRKGMYTFLELEQKLKSLPIQLDGLYRYHVDDLRQKFEDEDLVKIRKVLMFVSGGNALKPLTLEELRESLATPQNLECALHSNDDPIEEGRAHIASWKEFRWQLHAMCGPLVEVISAKTGATRPAYGVDDVDATDTVQLLHRTVKDFLANYDLAGPLSFNEADAVKFVKDTLRTYAGIVLPPTSTRYISLATSENSNWTQNIENVASYLSDKRLLPWILDTLPKDPLEKCKLLGIFHSLLQESAFPPLVSWTELELERVFGLHVDASCGLESAKSVISAHFVDYACSNGFTIAVKVLLEILSLDPSNHIMYAVFDAALMVAIKHEMLDFIQALTRFHDYEPECRFWEETEYTLMGMSCYLTPFEMAAAQTGNEAVATAVYDRNHRIFKSMPWDKWSFLSRGRKCWRRSREDWNAFLELTRKFKSNRLESLSFGHVREAIQLIVDRYNVA